MPYAILSAALIWLVLMPVHFRTKQSASKLPTLIAKVVPTLMAAAFAGAAAFSGASADAYARLLFIGLCICAMADLMIEIRFEIGGVLFFAGHMLYVAALLFYRALCWWNLAVFAGALAGLWLFLSRYRAEVPQRHIILGLSIYAGALAALLGLSLPLPFLAGSTRSLLAAFGAALFVASDLTLLHNTLRKAPVSCHFFSLGMYYMGQLLLGLSAFSTP